MKRRMKIALSLIVIVTLFACFKYWQERVVYNKIDEIIAEEGQSEEMISEKNEYLSKFDSYQKVIVYKD